MLARLRPAWGRVRHDCWRARTGWGTDVGRLGRVVARGRRIRWGWVWGGRGRVGSGRVGAGRGHGEAGGRPGTYRPWRSGHRRRGLKASVVGGGRRPIDPSPVVGLKATGPLPGRRPTTHKHTYAHIDCHRWPRQTDTTSHAVCLACRRGSTWPESGQ